MRVVSSLIVLMCMAAPAMLAQTQKTFPTDDEINLLLTQTERAIQQYKPLIDQEQVQMGKDGAEAAAKDRQTLDVLETALKAFRSKPGAPFMRSFIAHGWGRMGGVGGWPTLGFWKLDFPQKWVPHPTLRLRGPRRAVLARWGGRAMGGSTAGCPIFAMASSSLRWGGYLPIPKIFSANFPV